MKDEIDACSSIANESSLPSVESQASVSNARHSRLSLAD